MRLQADHSDAEEYNSEQYRRYHTDSDEGSYTESDVSSGDESLFEGFNYESLCPEAAKYKIRASGRKIPPPKFERDGLDFTVDIDPEVEVRLIIFENLVF